MPNECNMASTVVAFRLARIVTGSTGRVGMACIPSAERGAAGQMGGMLGAVGVLHLEADDLAAVEVQDQVKIEPSQLVDGVSGAIHQACQQVSEIGLRIGPL